MQCSAISFDRQLFVIGIWDLSDCESFLVDGSSLSLVDMNFFYAKNWISVFTIFLFLLLTFCLLTYLFKKVNFLVVNYF